MIPMNQKTSGFGGRECHLQSTACLGITVNNFLILSEKQMRPTADMLILFTFLSILLALHGTLGAKSKFLDRGTDKFVPKTRVLAIDHKSQEDELHDPVIPGHAWAERVYHIKTPLEEGSLVMYRFDLTGYSYGVAKPMDCLWVGYLFDNSTDSPLQTFNNCANPEGLEASTYIEGGYLNLKVGPISRFCNAFELFYQGHYQNATMGLEYDKYEVIATPVRGDRSSLWYPSNSQSNSIHQSGNLHNPSNTQLNNLHQSGNIHNPANWQGNAIHQAGNIHNPANWQGNAIHQAGNIHNPANWQGNAIHQAGNIHNPANWQGNSLSQIYRWGVPRRTIKRICYPITGNDNDIEVELYNQ